jgi:hypothetical protein
MNTGWRKQIDGAAIAHIVGAEIMGGPDKPGHDVI